MDYTFPMSPPGVRIVNVRMTASFVRKNDGPHFARELDDDSEHNNICHTMSTTVLKLRYGIQYTNVTTHRETAKKTVHHSTIEGQTYA